MAIKQQFSKVPGNGSHFFRTYTKITRGGLIPRMRITARNELICVHISVQGGVHVREHVHMYIHTHVYM